MKLKSLFAAALLIAASAVGAQNKVTFDPPAPAPDATPNVYRGTTNILTDAPSWQACLDTIAANAATRPVGTYTYGCDPGRTSIRVTVSPPDPVCTTPRPATTQTAQCAAPATGSWPQTRSVTPAAFPTCWSVTPWTPETAPAGACQQPPTECTNPIPPTETRQQQCPSGTTGPAYTQTLTYSRSAFPGCTISNTGWQPSQVPASCVPIVTPPPTTGASLYFSDCQTGSAATCVSGSNSNPGTEAAPKRDLSGINVSSLAANTRLYFVRGGVWSMSPQTLENMNTSAASPLVFDAYGTGALPEWKYNTDGVAWVFGGRWSNTSRDGGYTFRNIKLNGFRPDGTPSQQAFWFLHNVTDVTLDGVEVTGFWIAAYGTPLTLGSVSRITLRNSRWYRNGSMGWLGGADDLTIDNNTYEENNFNGDPRNHAIYLSNSRNVRITNNRLLRNSVVNGQCTGGNLTVHGEVDNLLIQGNLIEQTASAFTCYGIAITSGYDAVESFTNTVVRGNTIVNLGLCSICVNSSPGILIEANRSINTRNTYHVSVVEPANGESDVQSSGTARDNVACFTQPASGSAVANIRSLVGLNNRYITGAAATSGECAR